jgi:NADPH:quinone reductase-like Zn-dependent oxidoreductase
MAERVPVKTTHTIQVPDNVDAVTAAAIANPGMSSWLALNKRAALQAGESVLVIGAAGTSGRLAIQIARHLGAVTVGTTRSEEKLERLKALGLDEGIDTSVRGFREQLSAPVNVIVDPLGGPAYAENLAALALHGRLVMLGFLQGSMASAVDLRVMLHQRLTVVGTVMRARSLEERRALAGEYQIHLLPLFERGVLKPIVGDVVPMTEIAQAHATMEKNETFGKVVLVW